MNHSLNARSTDYEIRMMTARDAAACADIQVHQIPGTFINQLGLAFVREVYFKGLSRLSTCYANVCTFHGQVIGFFVVTTDHKALLGHLLRTRPGSALVCLSLQCLRRPTVIGRIFGFLQAGRPEVHAGAPAEILSWAFDPAHRHGGWPLKLYKHTMVELEANYHGPIRIQCWKGDQFIHRLHGLFGFKEPIEFTFLGREYTMLIRRGRKE